LYCRILSGLLIVAGMEVHGMAIAQRGRMSDRWQADNQLAAPRTGRRLIPLLALCVLLVGAGGLILWATGSNSAAGVSPSVTALVQTSNELVEKTGALETTAQQTIDQLQVVQDQLAAQQAETKKLTRRDRGVACKARCARTVGFRGDGPVGRGGGSVTESDPQGAQLSCCGSRDLP